MSNVETEIRAYTALFEDALAVQRREGDVDPVFLAKYTQRVVNGDWSGLVDGFRLPPVGQQQGSFSSSRAHGVPAPRVSSPAKRASDKQTSLIKRLANERDLLSLTLADRAKVDYVVGGGVPTSKGASALITTLLATVKDDRRRPAAPAAFDPEIGVYVKADGAVIRVYKGKQSGRLLAARVERTGSEYEFVYQGLASRFVTAADRRLTVEEAAEFGTLTGCCIFCGITLEDPTSQQRGIGPICFAKYC